MTRLMTALDFVAQQHAHIEETALVSVEWTTVGEPLNALVSMDNKWLVREAVGGSWNIYRRNASLAWERVAVRATLLESVRFATHGHRE